MTLSKEHINQHFGNKIRVRACGIFITDNQLLLIKHDNIGEHGFLWAPPGGGVEFGESVEDALKREFLEETGLEIEVERFLFTHEFLAPPLHAIELFFEVKKTKGKITKGIDPEINKNQQLILDLQLMSIEKIKQLNTQNLHQCLVGLTNWNTLLNSTSIFIKN